MAAKKKRSSSEKQLKATVKNLTAKLERSDAKAARWKKDQRQLKATIKNLTAELERSDARAERWKKETERHKAAATASQARVVKLDKKLTSARRAESRAATPKGVELNLADGSDAPEAVSAGKPTAIEEVEPAPTAQVNAHEESRSSVKPTDRADRSWTVARLREEASSRGLTGLSGKNKAQLIAALT